MGDGGAEGGAAMRGAFVSILDKVLRRPSQDDRFHLKLPANPLASSSTRPSYFDSSTFDAVKNTLRILIGYGWHVCMWVKSQIMWKSTWTRSVLVLSLGATICFLAMYCYLRLGSTRQIDSLYELKEGLNAGTSLNGAEFELDSDEYEFEDDSDAAAELNESGGQGRPLRRLFHLRNGHRRSGSKEAGVTKRGVSIVRITSSDPRSSLSASPFQIDLDSKSSPTPDASQEASNVSIVQQTGSVARRRRESGRLLNGISNGSSPTRTTSPVIRTSSSNRTTSPLGHNASPHRPARSQRRILHKGGLDSSSLTTSSSELPNGGEDEWNQSMTSNSTHSFASAGSDYEEDEATTPTRPTGPPSILKRKPESYASIPRIEPSALYSLNGDNWNDSTWQVGHPNEASKDSFENEFSFMIPPPSNNIGRLPPGAGHAPFSSMQQQQHQGPSSPRLGSLTPAQARAIWPEKRLKSIRLKEPDWTPYVDVHDRARERLEAAAQVAANPRSISPPITQAQQQQQQQQSISGLMTFDKEEEDNNWNPFDPRSTPQEDEEFWFERYSQSTAAAGRDWDWRKRRRARQMAAVAAAAASIEASSSSSSASAAGDATPVPSNPGKGSTTNLPEHAAEEGNVGLTDVQLQKQRLEQTNRTNLQLQQPEQQRERETNNLDLTSRPTLSVTTSDSYLFRHSLDQRSGGNSPLGKPNSSPLSKVLRLKKYSSPGPGLDRSSEERESQTIDYLTSEVNSNGTFSKSSIFANGSSNGSRRKRERGSLSGSRMRRSSETNQRDADDAVNVPNRFSSLTPKMVKRSLSAKRERDAAITAQLLAEAEEVPTDEEEQERVERIQQQQQPPRFIVRSVTAPNVPGLRKAASSSLLDLQYANPNRETHLSMDAAPGISTDVWGGSDTVRSSADAYGASPLPLPQPASPRRQATAPPAPRYHSPPIFVGHPAYGLVSEELTRQGSKSESQSSGGSSTVKHSPQDPPTLKSRARSGSRKGILSSATRATTGESDISTRRPYNEDTSLRRSISPQ